MTPSHPIPAPTPADLLRDAAADLERFRAFTHTSVGFPNAHDVGAAWLRRAVALENNNGRGGYLDESLKQHKAECERLKQDLTYARTAAAAAGGENLLLTERVEGLKKENAILEDTNNNLDAEVSELKDKLAEANFANDGLEDKFKERAGDAKRNMLRVEDLERENAEVRSAVDRMKKEADAHETSLGFLRELVEDLRKTIATQGREIEQLTAPDKEVA